MTTMTCIVLEKIVRASILASIQYNYTLIQCVGITGSDRKKIIGEICRVLENASRWVWMRQTREGERG